MVPREDLNSIPRTVPCLLPRTRQSLFFPDAPARLVLTVREDAPSLSRVASGLGAASGLWLPAISAVSSHPAPADSGPTTQPYSSGNILQGPACTAREQAVESEIPLRFGFLPLPGMRANLLPPASGAKASGSRGQLPILSDCLYFPAGTAGWADASGSGVRG